MTGEELREKDIAVLQAIRDGASTVDEIREATTLTNREINYSLTEYSLAELGYVDIHASEGREWRKIDGKEQYVWQPKTVELTDKAIRKFAQYEEVDRYEEMSRRELIERIHELEERQDRLETMFKDFRDKVMDKLSDSVS